MSRRANSPDTDADRELFDCITATPPQSFVVTAGAGSGKTTSLIKALERVIEQHGQSMLMKRQRVACITYTEVAANEIRTDVAAENLVHVSTIHSFYWTIASTFQADIKAWVLKGLQEHLDGLVNKVFGPKVQQKTKDKNKKDQVRYKKYLEAASKAPSFRYGVASDYEDGVLGHEDILKLCNYLLQHKPLFRRVVAQMRDRFCLGFFGDPMQKIYPRGAGKIGIEEGWKAITKPENFRCAQSILRVANAIRKEGDGLQQVRGLHELVDGVSQPVEGSARIFVLPNTGNRQAALSQLRAWSAAANGDEGWIEPENAVKILVIVHRIAAKRLGWAGIYAALNDQAPTSFKQGLLDGTCWPIRQLLGFVVPLVQAMDRADEFAAMNILREHCPRLQRAGTVGGSVSTVLKEVRGATLALQGMMRDPAATLGTVVAHLRDTQLLTLDPRMERALGLEADVEDGATVNAEAEADGGEEGAGSSPAADLSVAKLLQCSTAELLPYAQYVAAGSPFATQHGVKGAQFDRVLVVMDEEESDYNLYDYEKVLSEKQASADDRKAFESGNDNTWSRTLRLLYVCCTRAKHGLALAFFVANPEATAAHIVGSGIFPKAEVITQDILDLA
jgi:DNA helicase-2/ATP-dependent DNA helicase PcrA